MDAPLLASHELIRPWRRATIAASVIAAAELVLLLGAATMLLAKPVARAIQHHATVADSSKPSKELAKAIKAMNAPGGKALPRETMKIMVFNGNGVNGAAGAAAAKLHGLGYKIAGTANAQREDYATTVVMYARGFRADGVELAHDLGVQAVGPLDGMTKHALRGGELAVIVGA